MQEPEQIPNTEAPEVQSATPTEQPDPKKAQPVSEATVQEPVQQEAQNQPTAGGTIVDSTEKMLSALGYLGFLCVLPLVLRRDSEFCKYHGKQGLIIAIFEMFLKLFVFFPGFYSVMLVLLFMIIIYCMVRAGRGNYVKLPMVSELAKGIKL